MIEVLGWIGAAISTGIGVPQAVKVIRRFRRGLPNDGVSAWTLALVVCSSIVWGVWAVAERQMAVVVPQIVNGPLTVVCLVMLVHERRRPPAEPLVGATCACGSPVAGRAR